MCLCEYICMYVYKHTYRDGLSQSLEYRVNFSQYTFVEHI